MKTKSDLKFIFDDELCITDEKNVCIDGYLWAEESLVKRLMEQERNIDPSASLFNFYPVYDVESEHMSVVGTYWVDSTSSPFKEEQREFELYLWPEEKVALRSAMEDYCMKESGMNCKDFVNSIRAESGLQAIEAKGTVEIYQLKDTEEGVYLLFMGSSYLEKKNIAVDGRNYDLIYSGPMLSGESLDDIYERFNRRHPVGYMGHSLSVSDVICVKEGDTSKAYFVDSFGFKALPDFLKQFAASKKPALDEMIKDAEGKKDIQASGKENICKDIER